MAFVIKSIKPQKANINAVRLEILNELRREGTEHVRQYKQTVKTWRQKPEFEFIISLTQPPSGAAVLSGTKSDIWRYLDQGTRIRWALMSKDWKSKTRPGKWPAGRGHGRVLIRGRKAMQKRNIGPRPGIRARGWTEDLAKRRKRPFQRNIIKAVQRGTKKMYR